MVLTRFCRFAQLHLRILRCAPCSSSSASSAAKASPKIIETSVKSDEEKPPQVALAVAERVREQFADERARLFAVVYVNQRQFKVTQDDLIHLHHNTPLDVGDRIRLEKVLAVGGRDFTVFGRPMLPPKSVTVMATVIEKTTTAPELDYHMVPSKNIKRIVWQSKELTVLRINEIIADGSLFTAEIHEPIQ